jgi:hypothetical protein
MIYNLERIVFISLVLTITHQIIYLIRHLVVISATCITSYPHEFLPSNSCYVDILIVDLFRESMMAFLNSKKAEPCKGFGKKSANMDLVGQFSIDTLFMCI